MVPETVVISSEVVLPVVDIEVDVAVIDRVVPSVGMELTVFVVVSSVGVSSVEMEVIDGVLSSVGVELIVFVVSSVGVDVTGFVVSSVDVKVPD